MAEMMDMSLMNSADDLTRSIEGNCSVPLFLSTIRL